MDASAAPSSHAAKSHLGWVIARQVAGWGMLALGIAGLLLPILPGWIFIGWGVVTLAPDIPWFARLLDRVADKVPKLRPIIERIERRASDQQQHHPPD